MAKKPKAEATKPVTSDQQGLPPEGGTPAVVTNPDTPVETPDPDPTDAPDAPDEPEMSAYDKAAAFEPSTWDELPADPEVAKAYLALNGHLVTYAKRKR